MGMAISVTTAILVTFFIVGMAALFTFVTALVCSLKWLLETVFSSNVVIRSIAMICNTCNTGVSCNFEPYLQCKVPNHVVTTWELYSVYFSHHGKLIQIIQTISKNWTWMEPQNGRKAVEKGDSKTWNLEHLYTFITYLQSWRSSINSPSFSRGEVVLQVLQGTLLLANSWNCHAKRGLGANEPSPLPAS